ncbi:MAG: tyrosine-type recombinase/integrase [Chloroflexi bacterium]|nr:tyrosine-type recombinase/integrase [Chloroflexota bacterium]
MTNQLAVYRPDGLERIVNLVADSVTSANSRRAYGRALNDFLAWYDGQGRPGLSKATVNAYKSYLLAQGLSPASVNQAMSAIRKLATEAADNGLLAPELAAGIARAQGVKAAGVRAGNWLSRHEAQALLNTPDVSTLKGLRDRAILAVMIGAGLRVSEVAALAFAHVQQREGRWVIVDLVGKGNRVRTVPMPAWAKHAIDQWAAAAKGLYVGPVFRPVNKAGRVDGDGMTPQAIYYLVKEQAAAAGFVAIAPHDLRRTFAKLAHKGGAALDQIQLTLGHASIKTTERYLGVEQNLSQAPCDVLGIGLK